MLNALQQRNQTLILEIIRNSVRSVELEGFRRMRMYKCNMLLLFMQAFYKIFFILIFARSKRVLNCSTLVI